jgi:hypothetical protein
LAKLPEKKPPPARDAEGRKTFSFGDGVIERWMGAALFGAVCVVGGALKVRLPRLPEDVPLPARAKASPARLAASAIAKVRMSVVWRIDMNKESCLNRGNAPRRAKYGLPCAKVQRVLARQSQTGS